MFLRWQGTLKCSDRIPYQCFWYAKAFVTYVTNPVPKLTTFKRLFFSSWTAIVLKYLRTVYIWELSTLPSIDYCFANIPMIDDSINMDALRFSLTSNTNNQNGTEVFTRFVLSQKTGFGSMYQFGLGKITWIIKK